MTELGTLENRVYKNVSIQERGEVMGLFKDNFCKILLTVELVGYELVLLKYEISFYFALWRLSWTEEVELRKLTKDLLDREIIRHSSSPYASRIVLVPKKDRGMRLCIIYRELNKLTVKEHFSIFRIDDQLDRLLRNKYFSSLDLKTGLHHLKLMKIL